MSLTSVARSAAPPALALVLGCLLLVCGPPAAARVDPGPLGSYGVGALGSAALDRPALAAVLAARERPPAPTRGVWPLRPRPDVVAEFERPQSLWGRGHRGADLAGEVGQPVRAALPGTVSFVGRIAGRGVVVVDHGATRTTYEPVVGTVGRGDRVAAGAVVGRLAAVGSHCAPRTCLHWGWRRGEAYLDPLRLVGGGPGPVRLLPW